MSSYKKCIYISGVFLLISIGLIVFSFVMNSVIISGAKDGALMTEETNPLWAYIPGKSNVSIFKEHHFYDLKDIEDVIFKNKVVQGTEKGPYTVQEFDEMINRTYSGKDNSSVEFKMWRYHHNPSEEQTEKQKDIIKTINLPSLGVWYQARNAKQSQIALTSLYTIYNSLTKDFYYGAIQTALIQLPPANSTDYLSVFSDTYFTQEFKNNLTYDKDYGLFGNNNGFFVKAVMTHPSSDSKFLMDYWGLSEVEVKYLNDTLHAAKNTAFRTDNNIDMAAKQWLDLSLNKGESISKLNSTADGFYLEYGAYLKFELKKEGRSSLTYDQAKRLFFEFNDIAIAGNLNAKNMIDDSACLINKKNLDTIFEMKESEAINFINNNLHIYNTEESTNIYGYLKYAVNEIAIGKFRGGNGGTAAISTFLSAALFQIFNNVGWDSYLGLLQRNINNNLIANKTCLEVLDYITLPLAFNSNVICGNPILDISLFENIPLWINGILYKDKKFKNILNATIENKLDDLDYIALTNDKSNIILTFSYYANQIINQYGIKGNYKAMDITPIAAVQWISSNVTLNFNTSSVKDWHLENYIVQPEFVRFCENQGYEVNIRNEEILSVANFDKLFSSRWISDMFIENKNNPQSSNPFASKQFVQYMRYLMIHEVLGLFINKSAKDLLWGYEDKLLKIIKGTNYFLGGDPTIDTKFSFLNNMDTVPDDENIWSMYTGLGQDNTNLTRVYKSIFGYNESVIIMREPYFDGNQTTWAFRNPWKSFVQLKGTDALSFPPNVDPDEIIWAYLDDLFRTCSFTFNSTKKFNKLKAHRFILTENSIYNKTLNPSNDAYYSEKYNGMGNLTSVFKVPMYASKPYYHDCDNLGKEMPIINRVAKNHTESNDEDDVKLFYESWVDVEPFTGVVLRAAQKILISAHIETDELFDIDNKFIPIYNIFRTGNFTEDSTIEVLGDLFIGLTAKYISQILGVCLTTLFISLMIFSFIKVKIYKNEHSERLI